MVNHVMIINSWSAITLITNDIQFIYAFIICNERFLFLATSYYISYTLITLIYPLKYYKK